MRTFYSTDHDGFYPVGVASVVMAKNKEAARVLLNEALQAGGLDTQVEYSLHELLPGQAKVLNDGNY